MFPHEFLHSRPAGAGSVYNQSLNSWSIFGKAVFALEVLLSVSLVGLKEPCSQQTVPRHFSPQAELPRVVLQSSLWYPTVVFFLYAYSLQCLRKMFGNCLCCGLSIKWGTVPLQKSLSNFVFLLPTQNWFLIRWRSIPLLGESCLHL